MDPLRMSQRLVVGQNVYVTWTSMNGQWWAVSVNGRLQ